MAHEQTPYQQYLNLEYDRFLSGVDAFRVLLPSRTKDASIHSGEEGSYIEALFMNFLRERLPQICGVGTGFVLNLEHNEASYQTDIIVYDQVHNAPISRYGDAVVVPHYSLIAALSVKRRVTYQDLLKETAALSHIGALCGQPGRPNPYLAILACDHSAKSAFRTRVQTSYERMASCYPDRAERWSRNEVVSDLIVIDDFVIHGSATKDPKHPPKAVKFAFTGGNSVHRHLYLQYLLEGISNVLYWRFGPTAEIPTTFPKIGMSPMGEISICTESRPYRPAKPRQ